MQITVTARHMDLTDAIRDFCHERLQHALMDLPQAVSAHVILDVEKYRHSAEVILQGVHHTKVEAKDESDNMYASIENAVEKAARQLRRVRDKVTDHKSRPKLGELEAETSGQGGAGE